MKGLILCGGKGTRLKPVTDSLPKQLIPIANKPLLFYTIELLLKSGITEIGIVVNENNKHIFKEILEKSFKIDFQYIVQKKPIGIANGLLEAESFINNEKFIMVLGDNSFEIDLEGFIKKFMEGENNFRLLLEEVDNPEDFGVAIINNNRIINLEEKPKIAYSNFAITGIYAFDSNIFDACKNISPSKRGEYEITDAMKWLIGKGYSAGYDILSGYWRDVGSHTDVIKENINKLICIEEDIKGHIEKSIVSGKVIIEKGGVIYNSVVRGPIVVGENSIIKNSYIGPYTSIGKGVNIDKSNIECSIILDSSSISSVETAIDYSILGEGTIITREKGIRDANRFITGKNSIIYLK